MPIVLVTLVVLVWLLLGAVAAVIEGRRGFGRRGWFVSVVLGPFALDLALRRPRPTHNEPTVLTRGQRRSGAIDVLIGIDGSDASLAAARLALTLLGDRVGRTTVATVLDYETAGPSAHDVLHPGRWPEERAARTELAAAVETLRAVAGIESGAVMLAGEPAAALATYAADQGFEVIVAGCRGRGLTKLLMGSCASRLASCASVPVLLVPSPDDPATDHRVVGSSSPAP
jgi:nucleotide-binding universal stress UspA family protein